MNNKNRIKLILFIMAVTVCITPLTTAVDAAEKEEVQSLISIAEKRLEALKQGGDSAYAGDEIEKITLYLGEAKNDLKKGNDELAYYKISIGMAYFRKIEALKEQAEAEAGLNAVKEKLGK